MSMKALGNRNKKAAAQGNFKKKKRKADPVHHHEFVQQSDGEVCKTCGFTVEREEWA